MQGGAVRKEGGKARAAERRALAKALRQEIIWHIHGQMRRPRVPGAEEGQNQVIGVEVRGRVRHRACEAWLALEGTLDFIQNVKGSPWGIREVRGHHNLIGI